LAAYSFRRTKISCAKAQHADRAVQVRRVELHGDQAALRDLGLHGARREDADAGTERYRFLDGLDIVEVHRQVDGGAIGPQEFVQLAPDRKIFVEADEVLAVEVGGENRPA
jgi:hypothetical protein